jgi:drug/metabolite transporter (DMT)-like permease
VTADEVPDEPVPAVHPSTPLGAGAAFAAVVMWSLGNVLIAGIPMNGLAIGTYRLGLGAVVYTAILYAQGGRLTRRTFRLGWKGGLAFGLDIATFFLAVRTTSVAIAVTLSALQPVVIAGFAAVMFGERIHRRHVVGTAVAVPAVALVAFGAGGDSPHSLFGDLMAVLAVLAWAAYFIASKRAREELATMEYMAVLNIVGFLTVVALAIPTGSLTGSGAGLTWETAAAIVAVLALPGSGHIVINWAHAHTTLMLSSLATLAMPVISTLAAAAFLDQPVTTVQVVGIVVVLVTLAYVVIGDSRAPRLDVAT